MKYGFIVYVGYNDLMEVNIEILQSDGTSVAHFWCAHECDPQAMPTNKTIDDK